MRDLFFTTVFVLFFFLRDESWSVAQSGLELLGISSLPTSASQVAWTTGMCHHVQLIFVFLVEMGFHLVDQDGLDLLTS